MSEGLLSGLLRQAMQLGIPIKPRLENNVIVIEITESEFINAVTRGLSDAQRKAISIKFHEGKMVITLRLF